VRPDPPLLRRCGKSSRPSLLRPEIKRIIEAIARDIVAQEKQEVSDAEARPIKEWLLERNCDEPIAPQKQEPQAWQGGGAAPLYPM
jgi:hypothetical protein